MKDPKGQLARWLEKLNELDFLVEFQAGKLHGNADALSRKPCQDASPQSPPAGCECTDMGIQYQAIALGQTGAQDAAVQFNLVCPTLDDCPRLEEPHVPLLDSSGGDSDWEEASSRVERACGPPTVMGTRMPFFSISPPYSVDGLWMSSGLTRRRTHTGFRCVSLPAYPILLNGNGFIWLMGF